MEGNFMDEKTIMTHKLTLKDRKGGNFTGVRDVLSFDVNEILLDTDCGRLQIKGKELHVDRPNCVIFHKLIDDQI